MDIQTFITNFENTIDGLELGSVTPDTEFQKLPQWDSLALLTLIAMVDGEYRVQISGKEVAGCRSILEIVDILKEKLG